MLFNAGDSGETTLKEEILLFYFKKGRHHSSYQLQHV
jgi:hypothetical protein